MKIGTLPRQFLGLILALAGLFGCYSFAVDAAKSGYSRLFSMFAIVQARIEPADTAVALTPNDPEAHYTRALTLVNLNQLEKAVAEFREAIRLRPYHYYQWLDLGVTLDRLNDQEGAMAALRESVRLAPAFAQPRWQLGSLLYRQARYEEAFDELRLAANSNPKLFEALLNLAWVVADGEVPAIERLLKPQDSSGKLLLATYLAKRGKGADSARYVRAALPIHEEAERALVSQIVETLITTGQFSEAWNVWTINHNTAGGPDVSPQFLNGDFVDPIAQNDPGFGWQPSPSPNVSLSIDPAGPISASRSLCISFNGEADPRTQIIRQIILVQANTSYSLSFATRTEAIVSGGPPVVTILDSSSGKALGQSSFIPTGTSAWKENDVAFLTDEKTRAITVSIQRLECSQSPCPIFGRLWVSRFSLAKSDLRRTGK